MDAPFELHLISIQWNATDKTVASISPATHQLAVLPHSHGYCAEALLYTRIEGNTAQLAVRSKEEAAILQDGEFTPLCKIHDPATGAEWWIERGRWDRSRGHFKAATCSLIGTAWFRIGSAVCSVDIYSPDFLEEETQRILDAFGDDLFALIYDPRSHAEGLGWGEQVLLSDAGIDAIKHFATATSRIIARPRTELRRTLARCVVSRAKPSVSALREVATKGMPLQVTSRIDEETADTPENRYLAFLAKRVHALLYHLCHGANALLDRLQSETVASKQEQRQLEESLRRGTRLVDLAVVRAQRTQLERDQKLFKSTWRARVAPLIATQPPGRRQQVRLRFRAMKTLLHGYSSSGSSCYLLAMKRYDDLLDYWIEAIVEFPSNLDLRDVIRVTGEYDGCFLGRWADANHDRLVVNGILDLQLRRHHHQLRIEALKALESGGGIQKIKDEGLLELKSELHAIRRRRVAVAKTRRRVRPRQRRLAELQDDLQRLVAAFKLLGVEPSHRSPRSVIYTQDLAYRRALDAYKTIVHQGRLNEEIIESVFVAMEGGLKDFPTIYERWCLLNIVLTLVNDFQFAPVQDDWRAEVVRFAVQRRSHDFSLWFHNQATGRRVQLVYQPQLGKLTPDYQLRLQTLHQDHWCQATVLTLDAKCKPYGDDYAWGLGHEVENLNQKYRTGEDDMVFVVHPSLLAVPSPMTPQPWALNSNYGGRALYEWEDHCPDHRRGGVVLHPKVPGEQSHVAPLKRLIGVLLEYSIEGSAITVDRERPFDAYPGHTPFCLACGGAKVEASVDQERARRPIASHGWKYWSVCQDCGHFTVYNYCRNCQQKLFKHGWHWTYHDIDVLDCFKVMCPACGDCLDS